jgi:hypothetical protein
MASRRVAVHVYRVAAGEWDNPYEPVATAGLFPDTEAAVRALEDARWRVFGTGETPMDTLWESPGSRGLYARLLPVASEVPPG